MAAKEKFFLEAYEQYPTEIDVLQIIVKLQEIEKLKNILLNPQQCQLLHLISKPSLVLEKEERAMFVNNDMEGIKNNYNMKKLRNYINRIKSKGEKISEVDQRLLKLIDEKYLQ